MKKIPFLTLALLFSLQVFAQNSAEKPSNGLGSIIGIVTDKETGDSIPFANVAVISDGKVITGCSTSFDGKIIIKAIIPATYLIQVSCIGYQRQRIEDIVIEADKSVELNIILEPNPKLGNEVIIIDIHPPVVPWDEQIKNDSIPPADDPVKKNRQHEKEVDIQKTGK